MDVLAQPLLTAKHKLSELNCQYTIKITRPTRSFFTVADDSLYVIRQRIDPEGVYHLVAAAKMGKEVL
ncbi:hypothetical protein HSX37_03010|uniref:Uncharacterized protein n=1 Tax=Dendrosporobacter quercicolus TaxID=146817 RepID=A0A1G9MHJ6_9FIRM|nr:hypothetical protein [Dendrosporobacter quercicolus]NSL47026.1 hypothetical protein [Dendrosporobacter quercicolus DSM 1736]SDL73135.1 hypothetical protein SAMN04488502_101678 [Dendrosporobacter quercicolus]